MPKARIAGTGLYAPGRALNNSEIKRFAGVEFDSEKIESQIGIKSRHVARISGLDETSADFAEKAVREAILSAGLEPGQIDAFIVGTDTPEFISPATAMLVQGRLQGGLTNHAAFDINASCASFVTAFNLASHMVACDPSIQYAAVIGVYNMPAYIRPGDAFGWSLFADGAGAFILEKVPDDNASGLIASDYVSDGTQWNYVGVYAGGTRRPVTHEVLKAGTWGLELLQRLPGDRNIKLWPPLIGRLCDKASVDVSSVRAFVLTQINRSVIEEVMRLLGQDTAKAPMVMDRYGYTGSACVPMAFHEAVREGNVKRGDRVLFCASGAGLAVAGSLFVY